MSASKSVATGRVTGSCACRRITFETNALPYNITACYCRECAKVSGAGYLPFAHFLVDNVRWSQPPDVWESSDIARRGFCKVCGSTISMEDYIDTHEIGIVLSVIDESSEPLSRMKKHIFLKEKADWVDVPNDGSERYEGHYPQFTSRVAKWKENKKQAQDQQ